jgi:hypothetical protein
MTVKKKAVKASIPIQYDIDDIINKGGKTTADAKPQTQQTDEELRFTLRIPQTLIEKIDQDRQARIGNVSRNQWILEAVSKYLN